MDMKRLVGEVLITLAKVGIIGGIGFAAWKDLNPKFAPGTQVFWRGIDKATCYKREGAIVIQETCPVNDKTLLTVVGQQNGMVIARIDAGPSVTLVYNTTFKRYLEWTSWENDSLRIAAAHLR